MTSNPCLYIVATSIGNDLDFTFRSISTIKNVDIIIGEERSTTERVLKKLRVLNKEILLLNEHNEKLEAVQILNYIVENKFSAALISEAGTPCIADPGAVLVNLCYEHNISVIPIPGVSSIIAALMVSGLMLGAFKYLGFLPANKGERCKHLQNIKHEKIPIVILDTPYRRNMLLNDIVTILGNQKQIVFAYKLTQPEELIIKSTAQTILKKTSTLPKGEFVIIIN